MCVCVSVCVYVSESVSLCMCVFVSVCVSVFVSVWVCVSVPVPVSVRLFVCLFVCLRVHICVNYPPLATFLLPNPRFAPHQPLPYTYRAYTPTHPFYTSSVKPCFISSGCTRGWKPSPPGAFTGSIDRAVGNHTPTVRPAGAIRLGLTLTSRATQQV